MEEITATIKMKGFKLKVFILLIKLIRLISVKGANKVFNWLFNNIDKFYTLKV